MKAFSDALVIALSIAAAGLVVAQTTSDTFTATATIKGGAVKASAPVSIRVTRYSSEQERATLLKAAKDQGNAKKVLAGLTDAGSIQIGDRRTAIKYAFRTVTDTGELVTVATAEPIVYLGAGMPDAKPQAGYDIAVAILDVKKAATGGTGELAPAAKLTIENSGALKLQDYGPTVVWLQDLKRAKQ